MATISGSCAQSQQPGKKAYLHFLYCPWVFPSGSVIRGARTRVNLSDISVHPFYLSSKIFSTSAILPFARLSGMYTWPQTGQRSTSCSNCLVRYLKLTLIFSRGTPHFVHIKLFVDVDFVSIPDHLQINSHSVSVSVKQLEAVGLIGFAIFHPVGKVADLTIADIGVFLLIQ